MLIIRDVQEKANYWDFSPSNLCRGTVVEGMRTADYTIRGLEKVFCLERKASSGELAGNLYTKQFENELKRMQLFKHAFVVCEFLLEDLFQFPYNSSIPKPIWKKLRVNSKGLLKRLFELEVKYNCKFIFAGNRGKEVAMILFKQMLEMYPDAITD